VSIQLLQGHIILVLINFIHYSELDDFVGLSFETISSVGPNAAIIHYSPSPATDKPITDKHIYLCDSGAQFK